MNGRRRTSLAAILAIPVLLPAVAVAQQEPSAGDFVLEKQEAVGTPAPVEELERALPRQGVQDLLAEANRLAEPGCKPTNPEMPETPSRSYCFEKGDNDTYDWYPQGITTVSDAQRDELWGSKQAILVSWYDKEKGPGNPGDEGIEKGARVSFLDPETNQYQHVLLVYPFEGKNGASYEAVTNPQKNSPDHPPKSTHAGGIVWYGNYLYMADTHRGIRAFDMRHILDLKAADDEGDISDEGKVGFDGDKYYGYGYRYVLPQVATWQQPGFDAENPSGGCAADKRPVYSYLSLDRSAVPDRLISGEFCDNDKYSGRVATWPMNGENGTPAADGRTWRADEVHELPKDLVPGDPDDGSKETDAGLVQGVTAYGDKWFISRLSGGGRDSNGHLITMSVRDGEMVNERCREVAAGVQNLSYWRGRNELWSLAEHPDNGDTEQKERRVLYALPPAPEGDQASCHN